MRSKELLKNKLYTIYAIQCESTGRVYIGSTSNFEQRIRAHFSDLKNGQKTVRINKNKREKSIWQCDFEKFGESEFHVFLIEENVPYSKEAERETHYINYYNATNPEFGYNVRISSRKPPLEFTKGLPVRKVGLPRYQCPPETVKLFLKGAEV